MRELREFIDQMQATSSSLDKVKILMQLAKVFPDVPLSKIVNDSSYKRQAVTQILFGMMK